MTSISADEFNGVPGHITADSLGRRQYSLEFKLKVIHDVKSAGLTISAAARRHDINANMLSKWIRFYEEGTLRASNVTVAHIAPVQIIPDPPSRPNTLAIAAASAPPAPEPSGRQATMTIKLPNQALLKVAADIDRTLLRSALLVIREM
jgi:transposase